MIVKLVLMLALALVLSAAPQSPLTTGIPGVVAPGATIELVQEGFAFTEGPVGTADGGLLFTDLLTSERIHRVAPNGAVTVFREKTNGMNGLAVTANGDVYGVETTGKRVSRIANGQLTVLTEGSPERPLLAPNDLILDAKGGVYFTDPGPRPVVAGRIVYVYYLPAGAKAPVLLDDKIVRPNGIILTNDGKTLLVNDSNGPTIFAYNVTAEGAVANKRPFAMLLNVGPDGVSGADGMAVDREDRLYVTTTAGVQIFDRSGRHLGTIPVPRQPSNVAFSGPDRKTLFITAREGLYRLRMLAQGPNRPGK